jgi:hypothetical protein
MINSRLFQEPRLRSPRWVGLDNAEALSGLTIAQLLEPGRPIVFNLGFSHLDMKVAETLTGSPEGGFRAAGGAIAASPSPQPPG